MDVGQGTHYGNLLSYKYYMRPTAQKMYGHSPNTKIKHHENVQKILQILALNGTCTTWEMAKIRFPNDNDKVRTKEKEFRRLLVGRIDRGKHSSGMLELGLVVKDGKVYRHPVSDKYRLSLHGILYCLDVLNLNKNDIDKISEKYADVLPKVFGKWDYLKSATEDQVYTIQILARGLLLDNPEIVKNKTNPMYELMSFIHTKFRKNFESISERDLAEQISLWFYTYLLYDTELKSKARSLTSVKKLQRILDQDDSLSRWYLKFVKDADRYYAKRADTIKKSGLL
ncbi:MAG: hypothetical protein GKS07_01230 [Nitrosopumilus sp.]|nr:MAG: hypothetical protein GKS07_01230 [Nitrosopumilus sp.]